MTAIRSAKHATRRTWDELTASEAGSSNREFRSSLTKARDSDRARVIRFYPRGSVLFYEGQPLRGVYVLCEGRAKVLVTSPEGKTCLLRIASAGDLLGVKAVLTDSPSGATVQALDQCSVEFVPGEELRKLLACNREACLGVAHALSSKLDAIMGHTRLLLLSQSAAEKFARLILRWCDELGRGDGAEIEINHGLTHEEIAQMICTSRETVTRLFSESRRRNILSRSDNAVVVLNRKSLESMAGY